MPVNIKGDNGLDITTDGSNNPRIQGDFSNATVANQVMVQTSTTNGNTNLRVLPNGTATTSRLVAQNNSDPTNAGSMGVVVTSTEGQLVSSYNGTGTYLPMTFYTGGSERMRIDTSGCFGIGRIASTAYRIILQSIGNTSATFAQLWQDSSASNLFGVRDDGAVLAFSPTGGLGYGTGAGGTVTQLTSKSTAVTLNKPTGQITMNNAALAANTTVQFSFNNSLIAPTDLLVLNILRSSVTSSQNYLVWADISNANPFISVRNISAGSLSEAVVLNFAIIKGATA